MINATLSQMELLVGFRIRVYIVSQCSALKRSGFKWAAKHKNWTEMLMSEMFAELWSSWHQPARLRLHHSFITGHTSVCWFYRILSRISHTLHFPHEKGRVCTEPSDPGSTPVWDRYTPILHLRLWVTAANLGEWGNHMRLWWFTLRYC